MSKKQLSCEEQLKKYVNDLQDSLKRWNFINENGCSDPFWCDGVNMNLVRNHCLYYKDNIMRLCTENGLPLPDEFYLPVPPKVEGNFMANRKDSRIKNLTDFNKGFTFKKVKYDPEQLSL